MYKIPIVRACNSCQIYDFIKGQSKTNFLLNSYLVTVISVYVRAVGGEVPATSTLAPKIGPLGLVSSSPLCTTNHIYHQLLLALVNQ